MTGFKSKRAAALDKEIVTDIDGHIVRDVRKPKKAQPAQEPVAIVAVDVGGQIQVGWIKKPQHNDKLYTTPPQRQLVDLTSADWKEIEDMPDVFDQGVAWCLARLKEKNT